MLAISFVNPAIVVIDRRRYLTIADEDLPGGRLKLVVLGEAHQSHRQIKFEGPALTSDGAELFFDNYRPGTPFDPAYVKTPTLAAV